MGVPGLTTFIDQNPQLLSDHKLHDTRLLIDGNNLYHFLYYYFRVGVEYGGDYDIYAQKVRYFFRTLYTCNITPIVVFDGGYDANDKKLKTALKRARDRIHLANFLSFGQRGRILPILCYETFRLVLEELAIAHVSCDFEADDQIAALANMWDCPVLTNDSDFFIYNLKAGAILLDYLNLDVQTAGNDPQVKYLEVQMYCIDTFLQMFKDMDRRMFPLFATLMGNDYVDITLLEPFFSTVRLPKATSKRFTTPERHRKITSLLLWLESVHDYDHAFEKILTHFKQDKRKAVQVAMEKSVDTYTKLETNVHLYLEEKDMKSRPRSKLRTFDGNPLPYWFVARVRSGDLTPMVLDALVLHRVILLSQVETMAQPSAYDISLPLRQILYGILLTLDCELAKKDSRKAANRASPITEYNREQKNLKKVLVLPQFEMTEGRAAVPYLQSIPHLDEAEREQVLMQAVGEAPETLTSVSRDLQLVMVAVIYWCHHAVPGVREGHLAALLTTILKLNTLDQLVTRDQESEGCEGGQCDVFSYQCSMAQVTRAHGNLARFTKPPQHNRVVMFDGAAVHAFSQFQACLRDIMALNKILQCPLHSPSPSRIFNVTLLYNLYRDFSSRANVLLYIEELLGRGSGLAQAFSYLYTTVVSHVPEGCLGLGKGQATRNKKKRGKKTGRGAGGGSSVGGTGDETGVSGVDGGETGTHTMLVTGDETGVSCVDGGETGTHTMLVTACEVTNRFEGLGLEE